MNQRQVQMIDYLRGRRVRLNDDQRRRLSAKAKGIGRKLLAEVAPSVTSETLLAWHRKLIAKNTTAVASAGRDDLESPERWSRWWFEWHKRTGLVAGRLSQEPIGETLPAGESQGSRMPKAATATPPANVMLSLFDGTRQPFKTKTNVLVRVLDGNQKQLVADFFDKPNIFLQNLPFSDRLSHHLVALLPRGAGSKLTPVESIIGAYHPDSFRESEFRTKLRLR